MENSIDSMSKALFSHHERTLFEQEIPEESTWTMYFQDFFIRNNDVSQGCGDRFGYNDNSSLISDAASSVGAKKIVHKSGNRLMRSSKKTRIIAETPMDVNDLEDTASSPSNSPKIYSMVEELDKNPMQEEIRDISQEKGRGSCNITNERTEIGLNGKDAGAFTELKKKGLCLVPLSMFSNYLG